jgi:hypothetical protein
MRKDLTARADAVLWSRAECLRAGRRLADFASPILGYWTGWSTETDGIMYEFEVLATFAVIGGIYFGLFFAYEKLFLK